VTLRDGGLAPPTVPLNEMAEGEMEIVPVDGVGVPLPTYFMFAKSLAGLLPILTI
jgi:hypothetical protein